MPVPVTIPFGPVDAVTPEGRLVGARGATLGVRVREVRDLVPDPSRPSGQPATGYAVPAPPALVSTAAGRVAVFDHPSGSGVFSVTGDPGTQVQGARLGRGALFLATETPDGEATPLRRIAPDGTEATLAVSVPDVVLDVTTDVPDIGATGVMPGRYGLRQAYAYEDGSLGPATLPVVANVTGATSLPYVTVGSTAAASTTIDIAFAALVIPDPPVQDYYRAAGGRDTDAATGLPVLLVGDPAFQQRLLVTGVEAVPGQPRVARLTLSQALTFDVPADTPARFGERVRVTITRSADSPLPALARGVAVLLTAPIKADGTEDAAGLYASPYYVLGRIGPEAGSRVRVDGPEAAVLGGPVYAEGHVGAHAMLARRIAETAGRLVLGGVAFDLARPDLPHVQTTGDYEFVTRVTVETEGGPVVRWSAPARDEATLALSGEVSYPDARAAHMDVYAREFGTADRYRWAARIQLTPALTQNAAYAAAAPGEIDLAAAAANASAPLAPTDADRAAENAVLDDDAGRVLVSGFARPYELLAERLSRPGPAGQRVQGFAAFGGALSAGQFGEYPLVCFYDRSVFAAAFSDTGEILRWRPVEQERGAVGPQAFAAHAGGIYYLAADGLYALSASGGVSARLSAPVQRLSGARALGAVLTPSPASCVGVYDDGTRLEVWVGSADDGAPDDGPAGTWLYSVAASTQETPRWGRLSRARTFFLAASAPDVGLYGLDGAGLGGPAGALYAETDTDAERGLAFSVVTAGIESAGGSVAKVARLSAVADLSCPVLLSLFEDVPTDTAPGERPDASADGASADTPVFSGVLQPDERFEMRLGLRSRRLSVRLDAGTPAGTAVLPRVGDRLLSLTMATSGPVRSRRATLPGT